MTKSLRIAAVAIALSMTALMLFSVISLTGLLQTWFASFTRQQQYWLPKVLLIMPGLALALSAYLNTRRNRRMNCRDDG